MAESHNVARARQARLKRGQQRWRKLLQQNLDRARSLPRGPGRYILVNVPSAKLEVRDGERILETMRVGVRQKRMQTPIMPGMMRYAILNPYWHLPTDVRAALAQGRRKLGA